ncbi:adenosylcobinamide-phosphate synthase CbiB [Seleniivibrio woodruffii]|uniref:Cobalamin biosynthesis protein CobD n=1 Tax=Seleniivibrio woodruffii TaxID=1078050 RepID=A0A4R1K9H1_9BACT|nr:adenosylcobinamide-phosphate synthase CbiB [Seleniivibrio woodruffii]TCK61048.1 adenosylcobinamide-phosphate synthase [Seleniivibrio woodruffii]TVZ36676.1 adenosylcobinamide-phosphate synthase [Seleniivibrio woodruffii]
MTLNISYLLYIDFMAVITAFWLDWFLGEPDFPFHPVRIAGSAVSYCEKSLRRKSTIFEGVVSGFITLAFTLSVAGISLYYAAKAGTFWYFVVSTIIIYFTISVRSLAEHAQNVCKGLEESEEAGRKELAKIVSRDTQNMPKPKIITSAVESVSENYVDAVVSPLLFAALFGPMGAVLFKTVSTMDSMIGYKNERFLYYGRFAARFDDVLNFIPARLSIIPITIASILMRLNTKNAVKSFMRFRLSHASPNSAHPMSAFAGALNIRLGGAVSYFGQITEKPYIGDSEREPETSDIKKSVKLMELSSIIWAVICCLITLWKVM